MFDLRRDDVLLSRFVESGDAFDGDVVRFRGAGSKDDLARIGADQRSHLSSWEKRDAILTSISFTYCTKLESFIVKILKLYYFDSTKLEQIYN